MRAAVYNSAIPRFHLHTAKRALLPGFRIARVVFVVIALLGPAQAADWSTPEHQLARKIVAVTGPGAVALGFENRSSLGKRDAEIIQNGLQDALGGLGLRFVKAEQAAGTVAISLSENASSYVWVAEVKQGAGDSSIVMVSVPRPEGSISSRDFVPLTMRKSPLWSQDEPILDVAVLEENPSPAFIAVLASEKVSLYRFQSGRWQPEQELPIAHKRPWPRDLRGRLIPARDHLFDVYLPGVFCTSAAGAPLALNCRDSDDPWPLVSGALNGGALAVFPSAGLTNGPATVVPQMKAFFASTRNFFTGALTPGTGKFTTVPKFYTAALLPREKYTLWLFAATDGQTHLIDGMTDQAARLGWGSDLASVRTSCGAGWQVLSSSADQSEDSLHAYEFPDRDPVAVSPAVDFPGPITALWTESRGDTAVAVARNRETGSYEAYRVAMACGQ